MNDSFWWGKKLSHDKYIHHTKSFKMKLNISWNKKAEPSERKSHTASSLHSLMIYINAKLKKSNNNLLRNKMFKKNSASCNETR